MKYCRKGDVVLVISLLLVSIGSIAGVRNLYSGGRHAVVEVDGKHTLELSLDKNVTETVRGPLGETVIVIENGYAEIEESACPHKYCVRMGRISHMGEVIICVPNRVMVTIRGGSEEDSFDGVTQ